MSFLLFEALYQCVTYIWRLVVQWLSMKQKWHMYRYHVSFYMAITRACRRMSWKDHQHQEQPLLQDETLFQNIKPTM